MNQKVCYAQQQLKLVNSFHSLSTDAQNSASRIQMSTDQVRGNHFQLATFLLVERVVAVPIVNKQFLVPGV